MPHVWPLGNHGALSVLDSVMVAPGIYQQTGINGEFTAASGLPTTRQWNTYGSYKVSGVSQGYRSMLDTDHLLPVVGRLARDAASDTWRRLDVTPHPLTRAATTARADNELREGAEPGRPVIIGLAPVDQHGAPPMVGPSPLYGPDAATKWLKSLTGRGGKKIREAFGLDWLVGNYKAHTNSLDDHASLCAAAAEAADHYKGRDLVILGRRAHDAVAEALKTSRKMGDWTDTGGRRVVGFPDFADPWWSDVANQRAGRKIFAEAMRGAR